MHIYIYAYTHTRILKQLMKKEALNLKYSGAGFMGILEQKKGKTEML